jgi:dipeptidyl aminopeptidase/acylaminoacyl peptidase
MPVLQQHAASQSWAPWAKLPTCAGLRMNERLDHPPAEPELTLAVDHGGPAEAIVEAMHAPPPPRPLLSPRRDRLLLVDWCRYERLADLARPTLRLAGLCIDPRNNALVGTDHATGLRHCTLPDGKVAPVSLPDGSRVGSLRWNASGTMVAFTNTTATAVELWVLDVAAARARRLPVPRLNPVLGSALQWMPDQRTLLVKLVPPDRGPPPAARGVAPAPRVRDSAGARPSSTYEVGGSLRTPLDVALFDHHATCLLALVDALSGAVRPLDRPAVLAGVSPAPGGEHLLVERLLHPYPQQRTHRRFARAIEVWAADGRRIDEEARLAVAEEVPIDGVPSGPRGFCWRPTAPATLIWAEALDGGDPRRPVSPRDRVMQRPLGGAPAELFRTPQRYSGVDWIEGRALEGEGLVLISEIDRARRWIRTFLLDADDAQVSPRLLWDHSAEERYRHPGLLVHRMLPTGAWAVLRHDRFVYLDGQGATAEGDRPFLDRLDLATFATERLFRSSPEALESFLSLVDPAVGTYLTRRESPVDPPNVFLRALSTPVAGRVVAGEARWVSTLRRITTDPDPAPRLRGIRQQLVTYQRDDGVPLSFTLCLPPGAERGVRLPAVLWAYPSTYADRALAGQMERSVRRFTTIHGTSPLYLLLHGYAVLHDVAMPVVGAPGRTYDNFLEQIAANARAAIERAAELGVIDPGRVGVAGHSHGALMAVNLLAHTDLFAAAVAMSGAYNHTLRPFGFQSEKRTLWEAPELYLRLSPLMRADRIRRPLLLVHGEADANPGTPHEQSERFYEALRGAGGTVRLVTLPHEGHVYRARESIECVTREMIGWFDRHLPGAT